MFLTVQHYEALSSRSTLWTRFGKAGARCCWRNPGGEGNRKVKQALKGDHWSLWSATSWQLIFEQNVSDFDVGRLDSTMCPSSTWTLVASWLVQASAWGRESRNNSTIAKHKHLGACCSVRFLTCDRDLYSRLMDVPSPEAGEACTGKLTNSWFGCSMNMFFDFFWFCSGFRLVLLQSVSILALSLMFTQHGQTVTVESQRLKWFCEVSCETWSAAGSTSIALPTNHFNSASQTCFSGMWQ